MLKSVPKPTKTKCFDRYKKSVKSDHQKLLEKVDRPFSMLVRLLNSRQGICFCYICNRPYSILNIDNGHCITRDKEKTRYDFNNCRPQCKRCNRFSGESSKFIFTDKLKSELPEGLFEKMKYDSQFPFRWSDFELNQMYKEFKNQLRELQK